MSWFAQPLRACGGAASVADLRAKKSDRVAVAKEEENRAETRML
jgi:hypothetical protein